MEEEFVVIDPFHDDKRMPSLVVEMNKHHQPVWIDNLDQALLDKSVEEVYDCIQQTGLDPRTRVVVFGSLSAGWGFTIQHFSRIYAAKFGVPVDKMLEKLWGDWYFDTGSGQKKWTTSSSNGKFQRCCSQFVLHPIQTLCHTVLEGGPSSKKLDKMLRAINVDKTKDFFRYSNHRDLLTHILKQWLPHGSDPDDLVTDLTAPLLQGTLRSGHGGDDTGLDDDSLTVATTVTEMSGATQQSARKSRLAGGFIRKWFYGP